MFCDAAFERDDLTGQLLRVTCFHRDFHAARESARPGRKRTTLLSIVVMPRRSTPSNNKRTQSAPISVRASSFDDRIATSSYVFGPARFCSVRLMLSSLHGAHVCSRSKMFWIVAGRQRRFARFNQIAPTPLRPTARTSRGPDRGSRTRSGTRGRSLGRLIREQPRVLHDRPLPRSLDPARVALHFAERAAEGTFESRRRGNALRYERAGRPQIHAGSGRHFLQFDIVAAAGIDQAGITERDGALRG